MKNRMMRLAAAFMVAAVLVGCGTIPKEQCDKYEATYKNLVFISSYTELSKDQKAALAAAGAWLEMNCGWTKLKSQSDRWAPPNR